MGEYIEGVLRSRRDLSKSTVDPAVKRLKVRVRKIWVQLYTCCTPPVLHRPQKKNAKKPILPTNPRLEPPPLPPFSLRTMLRNSATTPASPLIRKSSTLRSTLWCSPYSVAKRQHFSCPLGTATLSLKFENVVPGR